MVTVTTPLANRTNSPAPKSDAMEDNLATLLKGCAQASRAVAAGSGVRREPAAPEQASGTTATATSAASAAAAAAASVARVMAEMTGCVAALPEVAAGRGILETAVAPGSADSPTPEWSPAPTRTASERGDDEAAAHSQALAESPETVDDAGASLLLSFQFQQGPPMPPAAEQTLTALAHHRDLMPMKRRGVADQASAFFCKHPGCGKSYGCPDAVRKHCRKKHSEWLRRLGHVGPSSYCTWKD